MTVARRILVTNDDGVHAPGIKLLEELARAISDDVWIVAPEEEQSGKGHALTLQEPLRYRRIAEKFYAVRGTPTDCVMMAVHKIMAEQKPTLILSGINRGCNLAEDMTYSGTISAAMEGAICGIPSIALSQEVTRESLGDPFAVARQHGFEVLRNLIDVPWDEGVLINVNFPPFQDRVKGVKTTHQGFRDDAELFINERQDLRGNNYYWLGFRRQYGAPKPDTDLEAIQDGYISVTPLHLNLTHEKSLPTIRNKVNKEF